MKNMISLVLIMLGFISCSIQPSKKYGVDRKYVIDSIEVAPLRYSNMVYILHKNALQELDSLIYPMYEGTESGKHFFINWSKVSIEPFSINHFAIDTSLCIVKEPLSRTDENYREISMRHSKVRETKFENSHCSVSEPKIRRIGNSDSISR